MSKCCGNCRYFNKWGNRLGECLFEVATPSALDATRYSMADFEGTDCPCFEFKPTPADSTVTVSVNSAGTTTEGTKDAGVISETRGVDPHR